MEFATWDEVALEVEEHLDVSPFMSAVCEERRVAREQRFREEK